MYFRYLRNVKIWISLLFLSSCYNSGPVVLKVVADEIQKDGPSDYSIFVQFIKNDSGYKFRKLNAPAIVFVDKEPSLDYFVKIGVLEIWSSIYLETKSRSTKEIVKKHADLHGAEVAWIVDGVEIKGEKKVESVVFFVSRVEQKENKRIFFSPLQMERIQKGY